MENKCFMKWVLEVANQEYNGKLKLFIRAINEI